MKKPVRICNNKWAPCGLQEARRLMLAERMDAANAAFEVGYESPSQFSREYRRLFGESPLRDITNLRRMVTERSAYEVYEQARPM